MPVEATGGAVGPELATVSLLADLARDAEPLELRGAREAPGGRHQPDVLLPGEARREGRVGDDRLEGLDRAEDLQFGRRQGGRVGRHRGEIIARRGALPKGLVYSMY
jgi:hypothetical protein